MVDCVESGGESTDSDGSCARREQRKKKPKHADDTFPIPLLVAGALGALVTFYYLVVASPVAEGPATRTDVKARGDGESVDEGDSNAENPGGSDAEKAGMSSLKKACLGSAGIVAVGGSCAGVYAWWTGTDPRVWVCGPCGSPVIPPLDDDESKIKEVIELVSKEGYDELFRNKGDYPDDKAWQRFGQVFAGGGADAKELTDTLFVNATSNPVDTNGVLDPSKISETALLVISFDGFHHAWHRFQGDRPRTEKGQTWDQGVRCCDQNNNILVKLV